MTTSVRAATEHAHSVLLRTVYGDLTRIADFASDDIVYHLADREVAPGSVRTVRGKRAVTANEVALHRATAGTLWADIDGIVANDFFGTVLGTFHARVDGREISFPFCGLWRFRDGLIVEHWQNAYDPALLPGLLRPESADA